MEPGSEAHPVHPAIEAWASDNGGGLDYLDYASQRLSLPEWLAMSRLFRPRFIEVSGCVIWDRAYAPDNFREWYTELNGDATSVEATLNQLRLWQVVDTEGADDECRVDQLADTIAFCWRSCLESDFPDKQFDGGVVSTEDGPVVRFVVRRETE